MKNPLKVLQRWSGRYRSRLATLGLALVLALLAGFSLWGAARNNAAAGQVNRDSTEQDVWQEARVELARAEAARHAYVEHGRPAAKADLARSTRALEGSLGFIVRHADPDDASFAQQVGTDLGRYQQATGRLLAAVDAGNHTDLARIEAREVDPAVTESRARPGLAPELQRRGDRPLHHRPGPQPRPPGRRRGVENALTLQQLDLLGCHAVQGYHISRPVAPEVLISWIEQQAATTGPEPGSVAAGEGP